MVNQADEVFGAVRRKHQQPVRGAGGVGDNELAQARARWRVQAIERLIEEGDRRARSQGSGTGNQLALAGAQGAVSAALIDAHLIQQLLRIPHVESRAHMLCGAQVLGHGGTGEQDIGAGARNRYL